MRDKSVGHSHALHAQPASVRCHVLAHRAEKASLDGSVLHGDYGAIPIYNTRERVFVNRLQETEVIDAHLAGERLRSLERNVCGRTYGQHGHIAALEQGLCLAH